MQKRQPPPSPIIINGCRPLAITKAEFFQVLRSPRIGQRALYWTRRGQPFVKILRQGGRGCTLLIDTLSAETFYTDLLEGKCQHMGPSGVRPIVLRALKPYLMLTVNIAPSIERISGMLTTATNAPIRTAKPPKISSNVTSQALARGNGTPTVLEARRTRPVHDSTWPIHGP